MPGGMFEPLMPKEQAHTPNPATGSEKTPIIPVPRDAPPMRFRHPKWGEPSVAYPYHLATGELAGYACRFDFVRDDGTPDKDVLPVTFCDLADGKRGWRAKGIPAPRPLYRLTDILSRPDAPILVCEGEKAVGAATQLFPEHDPTTPMRGANSPHLTDWTPVSGRVVVIWPDNDVAGHQFAHKVAGLVTEAGAAYVSIVDMPEDWPEKWDLADPVPEGIDAAVLEDLLSSAVPWQPPQWQQIEKIGRQFHSFGPYRMTDRGLFYDRGDQEKDKPPIWLSRPFEVLALTRDPNSSGWGLLLRWIDPDGQVHEWAMPSEALGGGRDEIW
jgi:putative DNA primase/helicase